MVTFETKVWEKDWEYILKGDYLRQMIAGCRYDFSCRQLIINNVTNRSRVEKYCEQKIKEGVLDVYYSVEDHEKEVLQHFDVTAESFTSGYHYSIAELTGIYKCNTDFLLHFSGDSFMIGNINWISEAIAIMHSNEKIMVANPTWGNKYAEAKEESFDELENFYLGYGFSDQCYLIRTQDFNKNIYNEQHEASARYPVYGGELFEKRVDAYMRNNGRLRITSKHCSYISKNFPRDWFSRKILRGIISKKRLGMK